MTWNVRVDNQASVTAAKASIVPRTTVLGVTGTLGTTNTGDTDEHPMMIAGKGVCTGQSVASTNIQKTTAGSGTDYRGWCWCDSYPVKIPAELGSSCDIDEVIWYYTAGSPAADRIGVARWNAGTSKYDVIKISDCVAGAYTANNPHSSVLVDPITVQDDDILLFEVKHTSATLMSWGAYEEATSGVNCYSEAGAIPAVGQSFAVGDMDNTFANKTLQFAAFTYTKAKKAVIDVSSITGDAVLRTRLHPYKGTPHYTIIEGAQLDAGTMTFEFHTIQSSYNGGTNNCADVVSQTLVIDADSDEITFDGDTLSLAAGYGPDLFDLILWHDPTNKKCSLFVINRSHGVLGTGGEASMEHPHVQCVPVKAADARGTTRNAYPASGDDGTREQRWAEVTITVSGSSAAAISAMGTARKPVIAMGASYTNSTTAPWSRGNVGAALADVTYSGYTNQPWVIAVSRGGGLLGAHPTNAANMVSQWLLFGLATVDDETFNGVYTGIASIVGTHDLCEFRDVAYLLLGYMVNDLWALTSDAYADWYNTHFPRFLIRMMEYAMGGYYTPPGPRNNEFIITSSVPAGQAADDSSGHYTRGTTVRKAMDNAAAALCETMGGIFVPITELIAVDTYNSTDERLSAAAEDAVNVNHLNTAYNRLVAQAISAAYED